MLQFGKCLVSGVGLVETCLSGAEAVLGGEEFCEWAVDLVADDFFVGDEDVLEDGLVELAADLVARAHVECVGIFEQFQVGVEELCSVAEVIDDGGEFGSKFVALPCDVGQAGTDLALGQCAVGGEVEEVLFLGIEGDQLVFELFAEEPLGCLGVGECGFHSGTHGSDERWREPDGLVVLLDCLLDPVDVRVGGVADVVLNTDAEEVEVCVALLADRAHEDHPFDRMVLKAAASAEESALEVVRMHSTAFARDRARF